MGNSQSPHIDCECETPCGGTLNGTDFCAVNQQSDCSGHRCDYKWEGYRRCECNAESKWRIPKAALEQVGLEVENMDSPLLNVYLCKQHVPMLLKDLFNRYLAKYGEKMVRGLMNYLYLQMDPDMAQLVLEAMKLDTIQ